MADEAHRAQVLKAAVDEYRKANAAAVKATLLFARATLASWIMHPQRQKLQLEWKTKRGRGPRRRRNGGRRRGPG